MPASEEQHDELKELVKVLSSMRKSYTQTLCVLCGAPSSEFKDFHTKFAKLPKLQARLFELCKISLT